jgi:hypothetical protein
MKITNQELERYVLTIREEEMGNDYRLDESQVKLISKVNQALKENPNLRNKITQLLQSSSKREMNAIQQGREYKPEQPTVTNIDSLTSKKVLVLKNQKRAGYVDALVMALVTGFMGGLSTAILWMMIK